MTRQNTRKDNIVVILYFNVWAEEAGLPRLLLVRTYSVLLQYLYLQVQVLVGKQLSPSEGVQTKPLQRVFDLEPMSSHLERSHPPMVPPQCTSNISI